jgi:hypothetical protein
MERRRMHIGYSCESDHWDDESVGALIIIRRMLETEWCDMDCIDLA